MQLSVPPRLYPARKMHKDRGEAILQSGGQGPGGQSCPCLKGLRSTRSLRTTCHPARLPSRFHDLRVSVKPWAPQADLLSVPRVTFCSRATGLRLKEGGCCISAFWTVRVLKSCWQPGAVEAWSGKPTEKGQQPDVYASIDWKLDYKLRMSNCSSVKLLE